MQVKQREIQRVLVTGASGFLGFRVLAALLETGLEVTALIKPEQEDKLATLEGRVRILYGDIWNRASLKGLSRGQHAVVHLVGSVHADPSRGLTYQQINLVSARHAVSMAVGDGVGNFLLLSAAGFPGLLPTEYLRSKRDAEEYLRNSGMHWIIVRPPALFVPSTRRPILQGLGLLGILPPTRWLGGRYLPLAVDIAARGMAAAVKAFQEHRERILYTNNLRTLARRNAPRGALVARPVIITGRSEQEQLDETPFGWLPPNPRRRSKP
jgi:uncharacterized protein YbjT (DUF2867 family)